MTKDKEMEPEHESIASQALVEQISDMESRLADLLSRMPAHSTPPAMIAELDALEEELALARSRLQKGNNTPLTKK